MRFVWAVPVALLLMALPTVAAEAQEPENDRCLSMGPELYRLSADPMYCVHIVTEMVQTLVQGPPS